jgi:putative oxidoreductase
MNAYHPEYAALLLRLSLGVMYLAHGGLKLFVFGLAGTTEFFVSTGFPGWTAPLVIAAEIVGGALLLLGVQTRAVVLALLPILFGAALVHLGNGWVFSAPNGGFEYPLFLIVVSLVQAALGDGAWALKLPHATTRRAVA